MPLGMQPTNYNYAKPVPHLKVNSISQECGLTNRLFTNQQIVRACVNSSRIISGVYYTEWRFLTHSPVEDPDGHMEGNWQAKNTTGASEKNKRERDYDYELVNTEK